MKRRDMQSGFTLIEIIVVMIIIGVLASIALPNLFTNVSRAQAGEAIAALGPDKSMVEGCIMGHPGSEGSCTTIAFTSTVHFTYTWGTAPVSVSSGANYSIVAGTSAAGDMIILTKSTSTGGLTCTGASGYAGAC